MKPHWHFINDGFLPGAINMERDVALAQDLAEGIGEPTIRLYGWQPSAVSLGYHQLEQEIDIERLKGDGVDLVRRPTGGRAILHAEELTYGVVIPSGTESIQSIYDHISSALVSGLQLLGVAVIIEKAQPHFPSLYKESESAMCFSSSARYEIKVEGKKLVGSAQRRYASVTHGSVALQHGSIMIGTRHQEIVEYLSLRDPSMRDRLRTRMPAQTTEIETVLGRSVPFEEVADVIRQGFEHSWNIELDAVTWDERLESMVVSNKHRTDQMDFHPHNHTKGYL